MAWNVIDKKKQVTIAGSTFAHLKITQIASSAYNSVRSIRADSSYVLKPSESAIGAQGIGSDEDTCPKMVR